jgi:hypothetical protein
MTAVEWLADEIIMLEEKLRLEEININDFMDAKDELVNRCLVMEKEQIKDAYDSGIWDVGCKTPNFDEYYKRTFKSE